MLSSGLSNQSASIFEAVCPEPAGGARAVLRSRRSWYRPSAGHRELRVSASVGKNKAPRAKHRNQHGHFMAWPLRGRNLLSAWAGAFEVPVSKHVVTVCSLGPVLLARYRRDVPVLPDIHVSMSLLL